MGSVEVRRGRQPTGVVYQTGYPCGQPGSLAEALWEATQHTPHSHSARQGGEGAGVGVWTHQLSSVTGSGPLESAHFLARLT